MIHLRSLLFPGVLALTGCAQGWSRRVDVEQCYRLTYEHRAHDDPNQMLARFVAIEPGKDSGAVRSGTSPSDPSSTFWRMFLVGGYWARVDRALELEFSNGFSAMSYRFSEIAGDTLRGQMQFYYDVVGQSPAPAPVTAIRIPCRQATLQA